MGLKGRLQSARPVLMVLCCILIIDGGLSDQTLRLVDFFFADDMVTFQDEKAAVPSPEYCC